MNATTSKCQCQGRNLEHDRSIHPSCRYTKPTTEDPMRTYKAVIHDHGPTATHRYQIVWIGRRPKSPDDTVLISVEMFERCIASLNREETR